MQEGPGKPKLNLCDILLVKGPTQAWMCCALVLTLSSGAPSSMPRHFSPQLALPKNRHPGL